MRLRLGVATIYTGLEHPLLATAVAIDVEPEEEIQVWVPQKPLPRQFL